METLLANVGYRYIVGIGVPLLLSIFGILGNKLVRGKGWAKEDFYLGVELTLAGMANGLVSSCELLKMTTGKLDAKIVPYVVASAVVTFFAFFIFLFLLSLHQDWESKVGSNPLHEVMLLGGVSNVLGLGTLIGSTILIPSLG
jgi:hypothetical protein